MAIRNVFKGGTSLSDEAGKPSDWNDTFNAFYQKIYSDTTGGSVASSTTETDLATVTISQNDFGSSASALISFTGKYKTVSGESAVFKIYVGGVEKASTGNLTNADVADTSSVADQHFETSIDSTAGDVIIKVTGQNSINTAGSSATVNCLTAIVVNNNS